MFGDTRGCEGTNIFLESQNGTKKLLFKNSNLVYDIEAGDLNSDGISDFILNSYSIVKNLMDAPSLKGDNVTERYIGFMKGDSLHYLPDSQYK